MNDLQTSYGQEAVFGALNNYQTGQLKDPLNNLLLLVNSSSSLNTEQSTLRLTSDLGDMLVAPGSPENIVQLSFKWTEREALYNNEVGIFVVDALGRVNGISPDDPGYAQAVLSNPFRQTIFTSGQNVGADQQLIVKGEDYLGFYLIQNNTLESWFEGNSQNTLCHIPLAFFSTEGTNPDGDYDHVRSREVENGAWEFRWEDLTYGGDQDFDDVVFTVGAKSYSYTSIAEALWGSRKVSNAQDLAGVLQYAGATAIQISQAFNYGLGFNLEIIANSLDEGTTFDYTDIAKGLWNSGKTDFNSQDLARVLQNEGATATEIAQAFNYGLNFNLEVIANALDDGATFNYTDIAKGLWNSGESFNSLDLARVLQNEGATATEIAQALNYGLDFTLEQIAQALDDGSTTFTYTNIAYALWNSGRSFNSLDLARVLQNEGANTIEVAQSLNYGIGRPLEGIAFDLDEGTTFNYTDIARGLWNSGKALDAPTLARVLQNEGATATEVAKGLNYGIGATLEQIADALDDGATFDYTDIAKGLWNSGKTDFNSQDLARVLQNEGATATEIAQAFNYGLGFTLETIADALDNGATFNYTNIAYALWNGVKTGYDSRYLAGVLQNEGATASQIAQALNFGIELTLGQIAFSLKIGTTFNYTDIAYALGNSGYNPDTRTLARVLQNVGATATQIAQAFNNAFELPLETIADALDDGATFNYTDIAKGLWDGVKTGYDSRYLAGVLEAEGANERQIAQALNYGVGLTVGQTADALYNGTSFNYTNVAKGLWSLNEITSIVMLARVLQNAGASATEIAQALNYSSIGGRLPLAQIASYLNDGTTFGYTDIAKALWNSGKSLDSRDLARILRHEGANARQIAQALAFGIDIRVSNEQIADALHDGADFNYTEIADALWNGVGSSNGDLSDYRLIVILREEGAGVQDTINAAHDITGISEFQAGLRVAQVAVKNLISDILSEAEAGAGALDEIYRDTKENVAQEIKAVGSVATEIATGVRDGVLEGARELATIPKQLEALGERALSPLKDEAFALLDRYNPISNLIKRSPFGDIQSFIRDRLNNSSSSVHDVLGAIRKPQTDTANTILYVLEGDFKGAWNSFSGSSTIQGLLNAGKSALSGNFEEAGKSFLKAIGIDLPAPLEKGVDRVLRSSKAPEEGIYQLLSSTGLSVKTLKAAAGEPGFTADEQAHALFNILAYPNIPFVSQIALAINSGYYLSEATKQFDLGQDSEAVKKLLTGAVSAAKVQNATDWVNAAWSLREVDFNNLKSAQSKNAFKDILSSGLAAIDIDNAKNWVFGAFDFADAVGGDNTKYASAIANIAIAAADIDDVNEQKNILKWAQVVWQFKDAPSSSDYTSQIREAFNQLGIVDQNKVNAALAKGTYQDALREAITIGLQDLTSDTVVNSDDVKALVDIAWDIKASNFDQALQKGFSYAGFGNEAGALVGALSSVRNGNYEQALTGILNTSGAPGAADLLEAGKALKDVKLDLNFDEQKKNVLISILRAVSGSSADANDRAGKSIESINS